MVIAAGKEEIAGAAGDPAAEHRTASPRPPPRLSRPRRLHNFSFPTLSWGVQRLLRCSTIPGAAAPEPVGSAAQTADRDHRTAREESPPSRPSPGAPDSKEEREVEKSPSCAAAEAARPWNLRKRRAACNASPEERYGYHSPAYGSLATEKINPSVKTARLTSHGTEKGKTYKFSISLSRAEIEEDFFAIKGAKPPRRRKKRAKIVQRQVDSLSPGLWLSEITPDTYKLAE